MDLFFAICQAIGIGLAVGIGGPLTALFVATMAHVGLGMDPEGTDWDYFASSAGVAVIFAVNVAAFYGQRAGVAMRIPYTVLAAVIGGVAGAASLAEEGEAAIIGLLLGAAAGIFAGLTAGAVLEGAKQRAADSDSEDALGAGGTLTLLFAAAGIVTAAVALFIPPASLLAVVGIAALAAGRRRKAGEKYEGLRVLR